MNNCGDNSDENPVSCVRYKNRCNFEVDTCEWYQDQDDQFDWTRAKGYAKSISQRPSTDNTKGNKFVLRACVHVCLHKQGNEINFKLEHVFV